VIFRKKEKHCVIIFIFINLEAGLGSFGACGKTSYHQQQHQQQQSRRPLALGFFLPIFFFRTQLPHGFLEDPNMRI
jgi:hypothetical protein